MINIIYKGYELLWLFFVTSFFGWILETVAAAVKQKKFVNRGLVNSPFCLLYGSTMIFLTIFCGELHGFWLYIGSVIVATVFEWTAGHFIEKIYHEKWWDYSDIRFNIDGYICLPVSAFWGVLSVVMIKWGNPFLIQVFHFIPEMIRIVIIWVLFILLNIDIIATLVVIRGKSHKIHHWKAVDRWFSNISFQLGHKIYTKVESRIQRAYPQTKKLEPLQEDTSVFAYGCSFHKIVWLFIIGSFLGDITETLYCRAMTGVWMSRSSVVWGPFSIVWGFAIAAATMLLHRYQKKPESVLFLAGTFLGGAYEYICSVFTEIVFGKVFWDYSKIPFNLGGRINLLYCFFWGIAAVIWMKVLYPKISAFIEKVPIKAGKIISWVMIVFMCCNMFISGMALIRSTQRENQIPAEKSWQKIMDERFHDERLRKIYPNMLNR